MEVSNKIDLSGNVDYEIVLKLSCSCKPFMLGTGLFFSVNIVVTQVLTKMFWLWKQTKKKRWEHIAQQQQLHKKEFLFDYNYRIDCFYEREIGKKEKIIVSGIDKVLLTWWA